MNDLVIQVAAMIIGTVLLGWFGLGGSHKTITISTSSRPPRKWKLMIVLGILMVLAGVAVFSNNFPLGGFNNPYSGAGFSLAFLGLLIYLFGKFGSWWNE